MVHMALQVFAMAGPVCSDSCPLSQFIDSVTCHFCDQQTVTACGADVYSVLYSACAWSQRRLRGLFLLQFGLQM